MFLMGDLEKPYFQKSLSHKFNELRRHFYQNQMFFEAP